MASESRRPKRHPGPQNRCLSFLREVRHLAFVEGVARALATRARPRALHNLVGVVVPLDFPSVGEVSFY